MRFIHSVLISSFLLASSVYSEGPSQTVTAEKSVENPFTIEQRKAKRQARYLQRVYKKTKHATEHGYNVNGKHVVLNPAVIKDMQHGTKVMYNPKRIPSGNNKYKTQVLVTTRDQVTAGVVYLGFKFNPVLLNSAHKHHPGDNVQGGKQNIEANFFRVSDYFKSLLPSENEHLKKQFKGGKYYVPTNGVIYSPHVFVFRENQARNFVFFPTPVQFGFIASSSLDSHEVSHSEFRKGMKRKIRAIFRAAWAKGHNVVILNDFEVYQHHNEPKEVSSLFRDVLKESEFKGVFAVVDFAIVASTDSQLFIAFSKRLEGLKQ